MGLGVRDHHAARRVLTVAWPGRTVLVVAVLFGVQLFVSGIFRLVMAFTDAGEGHRVAYALIGIFSFLVGILACDTSSRPWQRWH